MDLTELTHQFSSIALQHDDEIDVATAVLHIAATEYPALNFQYELVSLNALADGVSYRVVEECVVECWIEFYAYHVISLTIGKYSVRLSALAFNSTCFFACCAGILPP